MSPSSPSFHDQKLKIKKSIDEMKKKKLTETLHTMSKNTMTETSLPVFDSRLERELEKSRNYVIFKGIFRTRATKGAWGLFVFLADVKVGEIMSLCLWAGYGGLKHVTLDASWEALVSLMETEANSQDAQLRESILNILKKHFNAPEINLISNPELDDIQKTKSIDEAENGFSKELTRKLSLSFEVSIQMEKVPSEDINYFENIKKEFSSSDSDGEDLRDDDENKSSKVKKITITCGILVDPVRGEPVSTLQTGDLVYVTIREGSAIGTAIKKAMAHGKNERLIATFISAEKTTTGNLEMIVELSEGIYGKALVGDSYKLAIPNKNNDIAKDDLFKTPLFWGITVSILFTLILIKLIIK